MNLSSVKSQRGEKQKQKEVDAKVRGIQNYMPRWIFAEKHNEQNNKLTYEPS